MCCASLTYWPNFRTSPYVKGHFYHKKNIQNFICKLWQSFKKVKKGFPCILLFTKSSHPTFIEIVWGSCLGTLLSYEKILLNQQTNEFPRSVVQLDWRGNRVAKQGLLLKFNELYIIWSFSFSSFPWHNFWSD